MKFIKKISSIIEKIVIFTNKNLRKIIIYGIALFLFINFIFSDYGIIELISNNLKKKSIKTKIYQEEKHYDSLLKRVNELKYDTLEIERISRETYGMVKQNEKLYIYIEKKDTK